MRIVHRLAHAGHVAGHARGGFIVGDEHGLVSMRLVGLELLREDLDGDALAPRHVNDVDLEAHAGAHVGPQQRELAEAGDQHLVAGRQGVGHGGFPAAGARCREQEDLRLVGLEHLLHVGEERQGEGGKVRRALVFHRNVHREADRLRNVGRARNEEAAVSWHRVSPLCFVVLCSPWAGGGKLKTPGKPAFRHPLGWDFYHLFRL